MTGLQPDYTMPATISRQIRREIRQASEPHTYKDFKDHPFINSDLFLTEYFTEGRIHGLLGELFPHSVHPQWPVEENTIQEAYRKTFTILLHICQGESIEHFAKDPHLDDRNLLHDPETLREVFQRTDNKDPTSVANEFCREQCKWVTPTLELWRLKTWSKCHILPFQECQPISEKSAGASILSVFVPKAFVGETLRVHVPDAFETKSIRGKDTEGYRFVIKQFVDFGSNRAKEDFRREKKAFEALREHRNMIKYLGEWTQELLPGNLPQQKEPAPDYGTEFPVKTYNILLEHGTKDLDDYFSTVRAPVLPWEIKNLWKELYNVVVTLERIHEWKPHDNPYTFIGLHADIKPDNMIWVKCAAEGPGLKLRLADPGLFMYRRLDPDSTNVDELTIAGGTKTYGPPESQKGSQLRRTRKVDIWSLGCVFSIAASWIVGGVEFVESFTTLRTQWIKSLAAKKLAPGCDWSHDGEDVLPIISKWHELLRSQTRIADNITPQILDLVCSHMLRGVPSDRIGVTQLANKMKKILDTSADSEFKIPQIMKECLAEVDRKAVHGSSAAVISKPGTLANRKETTRNKELKPTSGRISSLYSVEATGSLTPGRSHIARQGTLPLDNFEHRPMNGASRNTPNYPGLSKRPVSINQSVRTSAFKRPFPFGSPGSATSPNAQRPIANPTSPPHSRPSLHGRHGSQDIWQAMTENRQARENPRTGQRTDAVLKQYITDRDLMFLVDNGPSMLAHWSKASWILEALADKCRGLDEDGMELFFTGSTSKTPYLDHVKTDIKSSIIPWPATPTASAFYKAMSKDENRPDATSRGTDMREALGKIFGRHQGELKRRAAKGLELKSFTVCVLTDGIWSEQSDNADIQSLLTTTVNKICENYEELGSMSRPVSVQFIQFGYDEQATQRLTQLDDGPPGQPNMDIVDCEPADGDINKMLCGSIHSSWDQLTPLSSGSQDNPMEDPRTLEQMAAAQRPY